MRFTAKAIKLKPLLLAWQHRMICFEPLCILKILPVPFVMHIPGLTVTSTTRYFASADEWRSRIIFQYGEGQIASVIVQNNQHPEESFRVKRADGSLCLLFKPDCNHTFRNFQSQLVAYLAKYQLIGFERPTHDLDVAYRDSLLKTQPIRIFEVEGVDGKKIKLKCSAG